MFQCSQSCGGCATNHLVGGGTQSPFRQGLRGRTAVSRPSNGLQSHFLTGGVGVQWFSAFPPPLVRWFVAHPRAPRRWPPASLHCQWHKHINTFNVSPSIQANLQALLPHTCKAPSLISAHTVTASTPPCCVLSPWEHTPFHITVRLNCHLQHLTDPLSPKAAG